MKQGTTEVKQAVKANTLTDVEVGQYGEALLTSKKTGQEISTRATGDSVQVTTKFNTASRQRFLCMGISSAALLYNDALTRTSTAVAVVDKDENNEDIVQRVLPLDGMFEDSGNELHFGKPGEGIRVIMDSDACNSNDTARVLPPIVVDMTAYSWKKGLDEDLEVDPEDEEVLDEDFNVTNGELVNATLSDASGGNDTIVTFTLDDTTGNETESVSNPWDTDESVVISPEKRSLRHPLQAQKPAKRHSNARTTSILAHNRQEFSKAIKAAALDGRVLNTDDSVVIEVDDEGSFVGGLPCTESYVDGSNLPDNVIDFVFSPLDDSVLNTLETPGGQSLSLVSVIKDELSDYVSDNLPSVLLPQKVCSGAEEDLATRGENAGIDACESLDMLGQTDVLAFGYYGE